MGTIKCIGILTSGGDAPGMNAAIRAVTRAAIYNGLQVKGIYRGYKGLVTGEIKEFKSQNVSNIIQLGGTILKTARCKEFTTPEGRQIAYDNMKKEGIDALVVIGGDGSLSGARIFAQEFDVPCIGLPGTIDNDLYGTDTTIGYDTALNTILDAVDKIRDTATSHERLFFVEVMGRDAGFLALNGAIASGAEAAIIPEFSTEVDQLEEFIKNGFRKSKNSSIVLVAESELTGMAGTLTTITFTPSSAVLKRTGTVMSRMVFSPGARNTFLYQTPYGTSTVGLETQRYRSTLGEHGGVLELLYVVDFDHACANRNQLKITVREQ